MAEVRYCRGRRGACSQLLLCSLTGRSPSWTSRSARLPELAEIFGEFLASGGPVGLDAVAELNHVPLEIKLVLLQP